MPDQPGPENRDPQQAQPSFQVRIPLEWDDAATVSTVYANQVVISHGGPEFCLVFGFVVPPLNTARPCPPSCRPWWRISAAPKAPNRAPPRQRARPLPARPRLPGLDHGHRTLAQRNESAGDDLLSHKVALVVPSALTGLTTGFGMGPGVSLSRESPTDSFSAVV
jgi:hypothetical protein